MLTECLTAKQYHPDRNPGHEGEVLAKFQIVQQAHEILSDSQLKVKYDADRAKLNKAKKVENEDPYGFRTPASRPQPTATRSAFQVPQQRSTQQRPGFDQPTSRQNGTNTAAGVDRFSQFGRPATTWDRTKFEQAARADAAHGFASMRSAQPTPQPPPRPPRPAPTAKQGANLGPERAFQQAGPGPGFPGMARTVNQRWPSHESRPQGQDENTTRGPSAYAGYAQGDYPQVSRPQPFPTQGGPPVSPTMQRSKPSSPLRHTRSQGYFGDVPPRPGMQHTSSRPYVSTGVGERTDLQPDHLSRSTSLRNSPIERQWEDPSRPGARPHSHYGPPPARHHSSSPQLRPDPRQEEARQDFYTHEPDTSSSDDNDPPSMGHNRPKAAPRKSRIPTDKGHARQNYRHYAAEENPALTAHHSNKNYTRVVDDNSGQTYRYPPPESRDGPSRQPFPNMTTPTDGPLPRNPDSPGGGRLHRSGTWAPKYVTSPSSSHKRSRDWASPRKQSHPHGVPNAFPAWAIPSSVSPTSVFSSKLVPISSNGRMKLPLVTTSPSNGQEDAADKHALPSSGPAHPTLQQPSPTTHKPHNVSQGDPLTTFSTADWDGQFSGKEHFQPMESHSRDRRSPSKTTRPRARSTATASGTSRIPEPPTDSQPTTTEDHQTPQQNDEDMRPQYASKAAAFAAAKFSADKWTEELKNQNWEVPNNEINKGRDKTRTPKRASKSTSARRTAPPSVTDNQEDYINTKAASGVTDPDAMDIDQTPPELGPEVLTIPKQADTLKQDDVHPTEKSAASAKPIPNGVDLSDLGTTAPFAPSNTGLGDLDDLNMNLPFTSRPGADPDLERQASGASAGSGYRHLNLPKPPIAVAAPLDGDLTQARWEEYTKYMYAYMHDWNVFNIKMIDHFRARQDQVNVGMIKYWISSITDGPRADRLVVSDTSLDQPRAGYAAYMQWLDDDDICRQWWEEASERHRTSMEELGRVRSEVKRMI